MPPDPRPPASGPWGYALVVTALVEGSLHDDAEAAKAALRRMEAAGPEGALLVHGHFERVETEPDVRETMGT